MLSVLNPWVLLGALAVVAGAWVHGYSSNDAADKVQAAWDKANRIAVEVRGKRIERARAQERALQAAADQERKLRHAEEERLRTELAAAHDELRKRPRRPATTGPADMPASPPRAGAEGGGGCTGAHLFGDDAEFLVRFATTAQRIKSQRDACYSRYEDAQRRLKELAR